VVFGTIVQCSAVWTERCGDKDGAVGKGGCGFAGQRNRTKQSSIGAGGVKADFCVAHAGDLVAGGLDAIGSGFDIGAMDSDDFFGRVFKNMRGPERAVDVGSEIFELRGHASVEDMYAAKKGVAGFGEVAHRAPASDASTEDMPEECKVNSDGREKRADEPGQPEEPSPVRAQRSEYGETEKGKRKWQRSEISVVRRLAKFADAVCKVEQHGDAKHRWKQHEQPGADCAPARKFEDGTGDKKNNCEPAEESFHRVPPTTAVAA
jgi:hypothetical protein